MEGIFIFMGITLGALFGTQIEQAWCQKHPDSQECRKCRVEHVMHQQPTSTDKNKEKNGH